MADRKLPAGLRNIVSGVGGIFSRLLIFSPPRGGVNKSQKKKSQTYRTRSRKQGFFICTRTRPGGQRIPQKRAESGKGKGKGKRR